jgi:hypothetical protein
MCQMGSLIFQPSCHTDIAGYEFNLIFHISQKIVAARDWTKVKLKRSIRLRLRLDL